jgi:hypothetical protein
MKKKPGSQPLRCAIYARTATVKKPDEDNSITEQVERCKPSSNRSCQRQLPARVCRHLARIRDAVYSEFIVNKSVCWLTLTVAPKASSRSSIEAIMSACLRRSKRLIAM